MLAELGLEQLSSKHQMVSLAAYQSCTSLEFVCNLFFSERRANQFQSAFLDLHFSKQELFVLLELVWPCVQHDFISIELFE